MYALKSAAGYQTDLWPEGVYIIGLVTYDFVTITQDQCKTIIAIGSKHIQPIPISPVKTKKK
jgi:hypothetical protein